MSTSDLGLFGCMSEGIDYVADVMARYEIIENLYGRQKIASSSRESELLNEGVIKVYTIILQYLAKRGSSGRRIQPKGWPRHYLATWKLNTMLCSQKLGKPTMK